MSKKSFFFTRKRSIAALSIALSATLSLGLLSACGGEETPTEDEEPTVSTATDTQLLKNGNFEFYDERDTKLEDKRTFISTPTSWSFSSGSPSSNARSGLIETESEEWKQITSPGSKNLSTFDRTQSGGETKQVTTFASIDDAVAYAISKLNDKRC